MRVKLVRYILLDNFGCSILTDLKKFMIDTIERDKIYDVWHSHRDILFWNVTNPMWRKINEDDN